MLRKLVCPNSEIHTTYEKILLIYDPDKTGRFYIHCGHLKCGWYAVDFNRLGGVKIKKMPENYHFDLERETTVVEE